MKKRFLALLILAALLVPVLSGVQAATSLCFVAVNDSVPLTLTDGAAPYYNGGKLYVPYTAFHANPNGVGASYNAEKKTFVLFNKEQMLIFDLDAGTYTDNRDQQYSVSLTTKGGVLYVPAKVAEHFGLYVTMLTSHSGYPIIRFTNGGQIYDDGMFVAQAENLIAHVASQHKQGAGGSYTEINGENSNEKGNGTAEPVQIYLAFAGDAVSENTLLKLKRYGVYAAFFVTEEQLLNQRQLIRKIYAAGHTVGLTTEPGEANPMDGLVRGNEAMDQVLFCRTVLALLPSGQQTEQFRVLADPGYTRAPADILKEPNRAHLYVLRSDPSEALEAFYQGDAALLQLLETSLVS